MAGLAAISWPHDSLLYFFLSSLDSEVRYAFLTCARLRPFPS